MKIDVHVHTKKTKSGDAKTREVTAKRFSEIVTSTDVKIIAITNHNVFDIEQYDAICSEVNDAVQIWPGVELDVKENGRRGHLIVIVSPQRKNKFSEIVGSLTENKTPDEFTASIDDVLQNFEILEPVYIAHYNQKKPNITDDDIDILLKNTKHKNRVIKEVTNSISAGIYISHGHSSIYGSDVHDWDEYEKLSHELPELRLPVNSFEHFCLLLDKDNKTINTVLDKKTSEEITIQPFEDSTKLTFKIYNDINVFFGSKGTGKSKILEGIAKHYSNKGIAAKVFESGTSKLDDIYRLKSNSLTIDLEDYNIDYCTNEIELLKKSQEENITSISSYEQYFSNITKNKNVQKVSIKDFKKEDTSQLKRKQQLIDEVFSTIHEFKKFTGANATLKDILGEKLILDLEILVEKMVEKIKAAQESEFIKLSESGLFNGLIDCINTELSRKSGSPSKPLSTGFKKYASNRVSIERNVNKIINNLEKPIEEKSEYVGSLGEKGDLYFKTTVIFQDGKTSNTSFKPLSSVSKSPQKKFSKSIYNISKTIYTNKLFEEILRMNNIEDIDSIKTVYELGQFNKCFTLEEEYSPSNGESSMLLLHRELQEDKDIYLLDEPEKSLGNDYINDVIVPLIKEKARMGKKVFICTHDANIAVRTLPYNSVYRTHAVDGYETYVGNPFSNDLNNLNDLSKKLDWKKISMRTLEGGEAAFGERGKIYGNV